MKMLHLVYVLEEISTFRQLMEHVYVRVGTFSLTPLVESKQMTSMVLRTARSEYV